MKRSKRIYALLGVLAVLCLATVAALRFEQRQEEIQNSETVILELAAADVQSLSWSYGETSLSFVRGEDSLWQWEEDGAFPVSQDKVDELLSLFAAFRVSFEISNVEDYSQYGLDEPVCTIQLTTAEQSYGVELGDFSKLDGQRYVSIGDGNAYLVSTDPLDSYELTIEDMICHDEALAYDQVTAIRYTGAEDWAVDYVENSTGSVCAEDVYFTGDLPLDSGRVDDYLSTVSGLRLSTYVSYNATEEELAEYGLDDPELTISVDYTVQGETEDETIPGSYTLQLSRSAQQRAMTEEEEGELSSWAAYARVGDSQIIYKITSATFETLMAASYDDLRHREVFTADFDLVTALDITLEETGYTLATGVDEESGEEELAWFYGAETVDITDVSSALGALSAAIFTDETSTGREEIRLTLHLDHEYFPQLEIVLYRYDGTYCLAAVDGESFALVPRSDVVELIEAVNAIVLSGNMS